jgi:hypothetical protein
MKILNIKKTIKADKINNTRSKRNNKIMKNYKTNPFKDHALCSIMLYKPNHT